MILFGLFERFKNFRFFLSSSLQMMTYSTNFFKRVNKQAAENVDEIKDIFRGAIFSECHQFWTFCSHSHFSQFPIFLYHLCLRKIEGKETFQTKCPLILLPHLVLPLTPTNRNRCQKVGSNSLCYTTLVGFAKWCIFSLNIYSPISVANEKKYFCVFLHLAESRKSAFSAASTRQQLGTNGAITPVVLDHVFLNKGNDFNITNSTFVCEVPGYYFFTYT